MVQVNTWTILKPLRSQLGIKPTPGSPLSPLRAFFKWSSKGSPERDEMESGSLVEITLCRRGVAIKALLTSPAPTNQFLIPATDKRRFSPSELGVGELIPKTLAESDPLLMSLRTILDLRTGFPKSSFPLSAQTHLLGIVRHVPPKPERTQEHYKTKQ